MDTWDTARSLLPGPFSGALARYPGAEEIRLRLGRAPGVVVGGRELQLCEERVTQDTLLHVLEKATGASLHAAAPALRGGYVSYRGLRIGVCGEAVYNGDKLNGLRSFGSLAIRIAHAELSECGPLIESLLRPQPQSVLIAAPPGVGKTSFLRELIRRAASLPLRVAVIDERNELSASVSGNPQFDLGQGSDVMVGVPKARAAMMLLRGMNPQIVAMDEITGEDELSAVEQLAGCGVQIYATAHGKNAEDMRKRTLYRELFARQIFGELVTIRCVGEKRVYEREAL